MKYSEIKMLADTARLLAPRDPEMVRRAAEVEESYLRHRAANPPAEIVHKVNNDALIEDDPADWRPANPEATVTAGVFTDVVGRMAETTGREIATLRRALILRLVEAERRLAELEKGTDR